MFTSRNRLPFLNWLLTCFLFLHNLNMTCLLFQEIFLIHFLLDNQQWSIDEWFFEELWLEHSHNDVYPRLSIWLFVNVVACLIILLLEFSETFSNGILWIFAIYAFFVKFMPTILKFSKNFKKIFFMDFLCFY